VSREKTPGLTSMSVNSSNSTLPLPSTSYVSNVLVTFVLNACSTSLTYTIVRRFEYTSYLYCINIVRQGRGMLSS